MQLAISWTSTCSVINRAAWTLRASRRQPITSIPLPFRSSSRPSHRHCSPRSGRRTSPMVPTKVMRPWVRRVRTGDEPPWASGRQIVAALEAECHVFHPRSPRGIADELFGPALPWLPATGPALAQQGHAANLGLQAAQYVKEQAALTWDELEQITGVARSTLLTWQRAARRGIVMRPRRGSLVRLTRLHGLVGELVEAKGADSARIWLRAGQPAPITLLASGSDADLDRFEDALEELLDAEHAPRRARLLAALAARSQEQEPALHEAFTAFANAEGQRDPIYDQAFVAHPSTEPEQP